MSVHYPRITDPDIVAGLQQAAIDCTLGSGLLIIPDEPVDPSVLESRVPELHPWRGVRVLALHSHVADAPCDETCSVYEQGPL